MNQNTRLGSDSSRVCQHCIFDPDFPATPQSRATLSEAKEICETTYSTFCKGITLEPTSGDDSPKYYLRSAYEPVTVIGAVRKLFKIKCLMIGRCLVAILWLAPVNRILKTSISYTRPIDERCDPVTASFLAWALDSPSIIKNLF